jgi:hypothetical protein
LGVTDAAAVLHILNMPDPEGRRCYALALTEELAAFERPMPVMDEYDLLLKGTFAFITALANQLNPHSFSDPANLHLLDPGSVNSFATRSYDRGIVGPTHAQFEHLSRDRRPRRQGVYRASQAA